MKNFVIVCILLSFFACSSESGQNAEARNYSKKGISSEDASVAFAVAKEGFEEATFAGGCFWCVEAVFERLKGVDDAISGYAGGEKENPTYREVSSGKTNHAEAVRIIFDPEIISFTQLLEVFFATHDPTQLNRQGPDVGRQYRTAIFYHNDSQQEAAKDMIRKYDEMGKFSSSIVTEVVPIIQFYPAEEYHQDFYQKHPRHPYIIAWLVAKLEKQEKQFKDLLKESELSSE